MPPVMMLNGEAAGRAEAPAELCGRTGCRSARCGVWDTQAVHGPIQRLLPGSSNSEFVSNT